MCQNLFYLLGAPFEKKCNKSTDKAYLENEECQKSVAPPPTAYYVQAIRSYWVSIGSLDEYIWRHQSDF